MNTDAVITAVIGVVGGLVGGAGGVEIIKGIFGRKPARVVAVDNEVKLAQQAAQQAAASAAFAQQMQESARQAWAQAQAAEARTRQVSKESQDRIDELEHRADDVQFNLDMAARYVVWLLSLIGEPAMTMDLLRDNVARRKPPAGVVRDGEG